MKLFNRGKEEAGTVVVPVPQGEPAKAVTAAPAPEPAEPDFSQVLDASVKEMADKIAQLTSSLESANSERASFEDKVQRMEERMRKLSSLTEAISSQYNPFVGDAPPREGRTARPPPPGSRPEGAGAALAAPSPAPAFAPPPTIPASIAIPAPREALPSERFLVPEDAPVAPPPAPAVAAPSAPPALKAASPRVHLEDVELTFQNSLLVLTWADTLLKSARSREGVAELLAYYRSIGWIGEGVERQLLSYVSGLAFVESAGPTDWRADVEIHERSLLFIEKLKGRAQP